MLYGTQSEFIGRNRTEKALLDFQTEQYNPGCEENQDNSEKACSEKFKTTMASICENYKRYVSFNLRHAAAEESLMAIDQLGIQALEAADIPMKTAITNQ